MCKCPVKVLNELKYLRLTNNPCILQDWMLARLLTALEEAGITSPVKTGELAFD